MLWDLFWKILGCCGSLLILLWAWRRHVNDASPKRTTQRLRDLIGIQEVEAKAHARILNEEERSTVVVLRPPGARTQRGKRSSSR